MPVTLQHFLPLFPVILLLSPLQVSGEDRTMGTYRDHGVTIRYEVQLKDVVPEVALQYLRARAELEKQLKRDTGSGITIFLLGSSLFKELVRDNDLITAFADPADGSMVIDHSKMNRTPFDLRRTIKHELCHLLLYRHITRENIPKWLHEGVAQWVSEGMADIIYFDRDKVLKGAVLFNGLLPLRSLRSRFPPSPELFKLSYEQSRSIVEYIDDTFGTDGVLEILDELQKGKDIEGAVLSALGVTMEELEGKWRRSLRIRYTWFRYVSDNIYWLIFFLGAVITVLGYLHLRVKMKKYADEEEEEDNG